jgi:hypothetical protein
MKKAVRTILIFILTGTLWGCFKGEPEYYSDYDIVYTNYDNQYNFQGHTSYTIPDRIVKITANVINGDAPQFVNSVYATPMLEKMKSNMDALGYIYTADTAAADLVLFPSSIEVTNISIYWDWWYYYWDWWYYWGWYYPYPIVSSYKTGSLFMNIADRNDISADGKRRIVWTGIINGLLEGPTSDITNRIDKSIDQAFKQSDYLQQ